MTALWQLAVGHAERLLQSQIATDRAALSANEARFEEERVRWAATLAEAKTAVAQAKTRQELAEYACANLDSQLRDSHGLREDRVAGGFGPASGSRPCPARGQTVAASP